jgi:nucleoside-diphosphate-sugar epimerase
MALEDAEVVLSTLGVPFTRKPITIYSEGTRNIVAAMSRHGIKRLAVVSSSATEPHHHADGGWLMNRVLQPLVTATIGKTTYADMRRMEELLRASDLEWTIMRPSGLFDAPAVSSYELHVERAPGIFTSRADLASSLLEQATDSRFVRQAVAVTTSEGVPTLFQMLRREAFKR